MMWEGLKVKDQQPQGQLTWHLPLSWTHTHTLSETMSTVCSHTASQALGLIKTLYNTHTQWSFLCVHCVLESGWGYQSIQQRVGGVFLPSFRPIKSKECSPRAAVDQTPSCVRVSASSLLKWSKHSRVWVDVKPNHNRRHRPAVLKTLNCPKWKGCFFTLVSISFKVFLPPNYTSTTFFYC